MTWQQRCLFALAAGCIATAAWLVAVASRAGRGIVAAAQWVERSLFWQVSGPVAVLLCAARRLTRWARGLIR